MYTNISSSGFDTILSAREGSEWKTNEAVIVVIEKEDTIILHEGRVTFVSEGHISVDKIRKSFEANSPYVLRDAEARLLQCMSVAQCWFQQDGPTFANQVCSQIRRIFKERTFIKGSLQQTSFDKALI